MASKISLVLIAAVVAAVLDVSSATISCYDGSKVGGVGVLTTETGCNICEKATSTVSGVTTVVSACEDSCTASSTTVDGVSTTITCCTTDLCNHSARLFASGSLPLVASVVSSLAAVLVLVHRN
jgi:hypothetical protein